MKYIITILLTIIICVGASIYGSNQIIKYQRQQDLKKLKEYYSKKDSVVVDSVVLDFNIEELQNKVYYYHNNWKKIKIELENKEKLFSKEQQKYDSLLIQYNELKKFVIEDLTKKYYGEEDTIR